MMMMVLVMMMVLCLDDDVLLLLLRVLLRELLLLLRELPLLRGRRAGAPLRLSRPGRGLEGSASRASARPRWTHPHHAPLALASQPSAGDVRGGARRELAEDAADAATPRVGVHAEKTPSRG